MRHFNRLFCFFSLIGASWIKAAALVVPAHSAYITPDPMAAEIRENQPIRRWQQDQQIVWYGRFKEKGEVTCAIDVTLPAGQESSWTLTVAGKSRTVSAKGTAATTRVDFGSFSIPQPGYQGFFLASNSKAKVEVAEIGSLAVDGPASKGAFFNTKERRNAASVHLSYPQPKDLNVAGFYTEVTALKDPVATYYMACGWHRGYFGMQVNSETERRIIFSVWDSGNEAVSRDKVGHADRVTLIAKGEGVNSGDFGNEGTGGHSHLKYMWKTGEVQRFYMTAKVIDENHTIFTGYWFHPEKKEWMLISSWRAPKEGKWLSGLYSFSENFGGHNGHLQRKALFGNQWLRSDTGTWHEITNASFSHDGTGKDDRFDRYMGVEKGQFFLSQGGFLDGYTEYGTRFERPATKGPPQDLKLPAHAEK